MHESRRADRRRDQSKVEANRMVKPKGGPKTGGRKRGTPNKLTTDLKSAILGAFAAVDGQAYLERVARDDPRVFCALLGRVLPITSTNTNINITPEKPPSGASSTSATAAGYASSEACRSVAPHGGSENRHPHALLLLRPVANGGRVPTYDAKGGHDMRGAMRDRGRARRRCPHRAGNRRSWVALPPTPSHRPHSFYIGETPEISGGHCPEIRRGTCELVDYNDAK
jgi:hypothetical protein